MQKNKSLQLLIPLVLLLAIYGFLYARNTKPAEEKPVLNSEALAIAEGFKSYCEENSAKTKGEENCYSQEFKKFAEQNGPQLSFEVLNNLQEIDPSTIGCHLLAHGIGWGSYKKEPENWRKLVQNMPTICNYGAIHGVLESYILSLPEKSLTQEIIPTICGQNPLADCNHIVGHLLLVQTDADVNDALDLCRVLNYDITQQRFCISGVFMEYQTALNLVDHDLVPDSWLNWPPRLPELEKLCRAHTGEHAIGCWEEIVHVALTAFNNNPQKIFDFCASAQVKEGAMRCKRHSLGVMGASKNFHLPSLKYMCALPQKDDDPNFELECYPNLVSSALSTIPTQVPEAIDFCGSLAEEFKQSCFSMIGGVGRAIPLTGELLPKACQSAPREYRDFCLGARNNKQGEFVRGAD